MGLGWGGGIWCHKNHFFDKIYGILCGEGDKKNQNTKQQY